jgi:superfamily I DNA and/or RNA helicase
VEKNRARINILDESAIVCSTLAFSGSSMFRMMARSFDVVVIDEAAQVWMCIYDTHTQYAVYSQPHNMHM